jgi:hypothetical protein
VKATASKTTLEGVQLKSPTTMSGDSPSPASRSISFARVAMSPRAIVGAWRS